MTFRSLKRDCPICQGARKDCRENRINNLVHCRHDDVSSVPGYRFIKQDALGFNIWAEDDGDDRSSAEWEETRRLKAAERERQLKEEAERRAQGLSAEERDREIRKLHSQLGLLPKHQQKLRDRGLTDAQIEAGKFFSIAPQQEVSGINPRLPGVDLRGQKLSTRDSGFACPIGNEQGQIIGWQTRLDDATDSKYRWATSKSKNRPDGATAHLQNGELPITFCRPLEGEASGIALAEGILKPFISAQKHNQIFIGAAGGLWTSSPLQLRHYLEVASAELGTKTVTLYPDGGAVTNKAIVRQYERTIELVTSLGYSVRIAWWNQLTKECADVDELKAGQQIFYLTPEQFSELSQKEIRKKRVKDIQAQLNRFTYQKTVNQKYLNIDYPDAGIIGVKSRKGSGKTESIKKLKEDCENRDEKILLLGCRNGLLTQTCNRTDIYHLQSLQPEKGSPELTHRFLRATPNLAMCVDSLWRLNPEDWKGATIIIDEIESVIKHLLNGNTCKKRRAELCKKLEELIQMVLRTGGRIVLMDAGLTDISVNYIKSLAPEGTSTYCVNNVYKSPEVWDVDWYVGSVNSKGLPLPNDDSLLLEGILNCLADGGIPVICSDSQVWCETLDQTLIEAGYSGGLRVDSKTSEEDPRVKKFLADPNGWLLANKPAYVSYSPTAESGLSIDVKYFTKMFAAFKGVVDVPTQEQMLGRVRPPIPRAIHTVTHGFKDDDCMHQLPSAINERLLGYETSNMLLNGLAPYLRNSTNPSDAERLEAMMRMYDPKRGFFVSPHLQTWADIKARINYSLANLRVGLQATLEAAGHQLKEVYDWRNGELKEEFKDSKEEILQKRAEAIANAEDISISQAKKILQSDSSKESERNKASKAFLKDSLPEVEITPELVRKTIIDGGGRWLRQTWTNWMLDHPEVQRDLDIKRYQWHLDQPLFMAQDIKGQSQKQELMRDLKVKKFIDPELIVSRDSPEVIAFMDKARSRKQDLFNAFGWVITEKTDPIKFLQTALRQLGASLTRHERKQIDGKEVYTYRIDPAYWEDPDRLAVCAAFNRKYAPLMGEHSEVAPTLVIAPTPSTPQSREDSFLGVYITEESSRPPTADFSNQERGEAAAACQREEKEVTESLPLQSAETPAEPTPEANQSTEQPSIYIEERWHETSPAFVARIMSSGQRFKYRFQGLVNDGLALIQSVINGVSYEVPLIELAPWQGSSWSAGRSPA